MTTIYLIRHAEAEGNLYRRAQGQYDSMITDMGFEQIKELTKRFENIHIDAVYSSDLTRTMVTASSIYPSHGLTLNTDPRLREVKMGAWEDVPWGEISERYPQEHNYFDFQIDKWHVDGAEDYFTLQNRITDAITDIASRHDGQTIAIFSHGCAIRVFLCGIMGISGDGFGDMKCGDNTSVTLLAYESGKFSVEYKGDNSHLRPEQSTLASQKWWRGDGSKDTNFYFVPFDSENDRTLYDAFRRDAWICAHGNEKGFDEGYFDFAKRHAAESKRAVSFAVFEGDKCGLLELDIQRGSDEKIGWITFLYVTEKYRGEGVAVSLIGEAVSVYRGLGRKKLSLNVAEENGRAIAFYEKYGFVKTGSIDGSVGKLFIMEKEISVEAQRPALK